MKIHSVYRPIILLPLLLALPFSSQRAEAQSATGKDIKLGAYYFDGWTGKYPQHITSKLTSSFSNRKPKWGWITSSQKVIDQQILAASGAGLSFFSFCWYYNGQESPRKEALNNALKYFIQSQYTSKMQFCLMVANHGKFSIRDDDWDGAQQEWLDLFKTANYLKVGRKPLLIFFSVPELVEGLGSVSAVKQRLQSLREAATAAGLNGVTLAACVGADAKSIRQAEDCGFDVLTGYNYHGPGLRSASRLNRSNTQQIPIDNMHTAERGQWNGIAQQSTLKYIPVSTLNWDPRPWSNNENNYDKAPYFTGYSEKSVFKSVSGMRKWMAAHESQLVSEKIGLLYAWNENGEGAYLTPTENGPNLLRGLQDALKN